MPPSFADINGAGDMKSGKTKPAKPVKRGVKSAAGLPSKSTGKKAVKKSTRNAAGSGNVSKPGKQEPSDGEWEVLDVLWDRGPATVSQVWVSLGRKWKVGVVRSFLDRLVAKDKARRLDDEPIYRFEAACDRGQSLCDRCLVFLDQCFGGSVHGSVRGFVAFYLDTAKVSRKDIDDLAGLLKTTTQKKGTNSHNKQRAGDRPPKSAKKSVATFPKTARISKLRQPSPGEWDVLNLLWADGHATATQISRSLNEKRPADKQLTREAAHTFLKRLIEKQLVRSTAEGNVLKFEPRYAREQLLCERCRAFLERHFDASFRGFLEFYLAETRLLPKKRQLLESLVRERRKRL